MWGGMAKLPYPPHIMEGVSSMPSTLAKNTNFSARDIRSVTVFFFHWFVSFTDNEMTPKE